MVVIKANSVSLSADGNTAIVGGPMDNGDFPLVPGAGAVWVWKMSGGVWTQQGPKLVGSGAVGNAQQGNSVSISANGDTAIVGGWGDHDGNGAAWIFAASTSPLPPEIMVQPVNQAVNAGANFTLTVAANGSPVPALQWQVSIDSGMTWTNLTNMAPYSGVTSENLMVTSVPSSLNGAQFRCVATNVGGSAMSAVVTLTVTVNADGSLDTSFNPGANRTVGAFAVQADGKILVGGQFTTLGGSGFGTTTRNYLGRLNADGSSVGYTVTARSSGNNLTLLWPDSATGYRVESALSLSPPLTWSNVAGSFQTNDGSISIVLPITGGQNFYRLIGP